MAGLTREQDAATSLVGGAAAARGDTSASSAKSARGLIREIMHVSFGSTAV
jgi:hypothetical protein